MRQLPPLARSLQVSCRKLVMSQPIPPSTDIQVQNRPITTRIVRGWEGYQAIEPHWRTLFERTPGADPQAVWPLVQLAIEGVRREYTPFFVTTYVEGKLTGIVPLLEPKRALFRARKNVKMLGYDSTEFGISVITSDPRTTWAAIELELRDYLTANRFEAIVIRRPATHLGPGAYVTDFAQTKQLRKVRPVGASISLTEPVEAHLSPKAAAWITTFQHAELKHSAFDEIGDGIQLLSKFVPDLAPDVSKQMSLLAEEGDGFIAWLEQDAKVVAAQAFVQTQDRLAVLAGGGAAIARLQLSTFRAAHAQGVEVVRFLTGTDDWVTRPAGLAEDVVIARV